MTLLLFISITDNGNVLKRAPKEKHTESYYVFGLLLISYISN